MSDNVLEFPQEKKKKRPIWRLIGLIILVLAIVALIAFWDQINFDRMMRDMSTWGLRKEDNFGTHTLVENSSSQYALFDDGMVAASVGGVVLLDRNTSRQVKVADAMDYPQVAVGNHSVLAYDIGGSRLVLTTDTMETLLSVEGSKPILDGAISNDDWVAYSALGDGFQTTITVCNPKGQVVYRWNDADSYLPQCAVAPGGSHMVALEFGQEDGYFQAKAHIFETDQESEGQEIILGDQLFYDVQFLSKSLFVAVGEDQLLYYNVEGEEVASYSYEGQQLLDYQIATSGKIALALDWTEGGTQLVTLDSHADVLGETQVSERVAELSMAGNYVAVLTSTALDIYKDNLASYATSEDVVGVTRILQEENGGCLYLRGGQIFLFNP